MIDSFTAEAWCDACDATTTQTVFSFDDGNETKECGICGNQEVYDDESWDIYDERDLVERFDQDHEDYESLWDRDSGGWD